MPRRPTSTSIAQKSGNDAPTTARPCSAPRRSSQAICLGCTICNSTRSRTRWRLRSLGPEEAFDSHWAKVLDDPSVAARAILVGGEFVGIVSCFPRDGQDHVGYWIDRAYWGRGIASRAFRLLLEEVTKRPLIATAATSNGASLRVLQKCGFVVERVHLCPPPSGTRSARKPCSCCGNHTANSSFISLQPSHGDQSNILQKDSTLLEDPPKLLEYTSESCRGGASVW